MAQIERLEQLVAARIENRRRYVEGLAGTAGSALPVERPGSATCSGCSAITIGDEFGCTRDELRRRLAARGIETRTFFVPIHLQPAYFDLYRGERYPIAEELGRTGLYLPSGAGLTESDIAYVCGEIDRARE